MICATCFNCAPMLVVGNCVFSAVDLASAADNAAASLMLCDKVSLAACTRDTPFSVVSKLVSAFTSAEGPASASDCPGASATGWVCVPAPSTTLPATEKKTGKSEELNFCAAI